MKQLIKLIIIFQAALMFSAVSYAEGNYKRPEKIEVFHSNGYKIKGLESEDLSQVEVIVYNLDAHVNLEKELNKSISVKGKSADKISTKEEVQEAKEQVAAAVERLKKEKRFDKLFSGIILSKRYGLKKYPAMVINSGEQVLYGVTDVTKALHIRKEHAKKLELGDRYESVRNDKK